MKSEQEESKMQKSIEGLLNKYTNVMKGWQHRWFVLIPSSGVLQYYMENDTNRTQPRGEISLAGASVSPSAEDSQTFIVNAANEETFRLRARDAKQRQFWVNRIRSVAECHTPNIAENYSPLLPHEIRSSLVFDKSSVPVSQSRSLYNYSRSAIPSQSLLSSVSEKVPQKETSPVNSMLKPHAVQTATSPRDALQSAQKMINTTTIKFQDLARTIEDLPASGPHAGCCDPDLLLLKATAGATLISLHQCYAILQYQFSLNTPASKPSKPKPLVERTPSQRKDRNILGHSDSTQSISGKMVPDASGEVIDIEDLPIPELHYTPEQKNTILHQMSQLKLGTDLTKVVLPSFFLEPHSLLESFADFMGHTHLFVQIPDGSTPEDRMVSVLEWYLTCFHVGRQGSLAKKPYNPLLGETFHCSWKIPRLNPTVNTVNPKSGDFIRVTYLAEQVSHHPPVSAFYVECSEKQMSLEACVRIKANFLGMSVGVILTGEVKLQLLSLGETYTFTLPNLFARSLLSVPWVELGGRVSLKCPATKYSAFVTFQTKPFYGGSLHRISGGVKNKNGAIICKVSGQWDGALKFTHIEGFEKEILVNQLPKFRKYVRPLEQQHVFESRRLWQQVTHGLQIGDVTTATGCKYNLENKQREEEEHRKRENILYQGKLFQQGNNSWVYKYPLAKSDSPS